MSLHDYGEDALIEQPAIRLFEELGWETANCFEEVAGPGSFLGRETRSEVVLVVRLRPALRKLNPRLPPQAIDAAIEALTRDLVTLSPARANQTMHQLIKNGVSVRYQDRFGEEAVDTVQVIDWEEPLENDFLLASQLWITGDLYTRRTDLVGFVNGLPLVFVELKASHVRIEDAYRKNLCDYRETIPQLFRHNAFIILSNGSQSRIGSTTASWEHFAEWKKIDSEREPGIISLETMIRGTCEPARLLDIVENFTLFSDGPSGLEKITGKNHQVLGVNNALSAARQIDQNRGKLGVFWHTQGAGKSYSMLFFAQKVLRRLPGHWTFVIVTDRVELDDQIYKTFARAGAVTEPEEDVHARSADHLRGLLGEDHRYVFTLVHKFRTERGRPHPVVSERPDIIVITDEAHRTQYDILAQNMRDALPNAAFIGFTGTPLMAGEERTRQVFGDYVSVYNFRQSVEDGATVPLWYENRIPALQLTNEAFESDMEALLDEAALDEQQEARLEREFSREYHLITRQDRLEAIAQDVVTHFMSRGYLGKAMVVSIDKATAVRLYNLVQRFWQAAIDDLQAQLAGANQSECERIEGQIDFMQSTDMAVVISQAQNEIEDFRARGLDIRPHRTRIVNEQLDEKFKDPADPLRIVFVCAMWMTGFDVKDCSTIYLDKPMRNHTLMQTIARANRVWQDKPNGLIVDYVGVFRDLQRALAIYGTGAGGSVGAGDMPVQDKNALVDALRDALAGAVDFCAGLGVSIEQLQAAPAEWEFIRQRDDAVEAILVDQETKQAFLDHARTVNKLFRAILPHPSAGDFSRQRAILAIIAARIQSLTPPVDISDVMEHVDDLLDESVAAEGYVITDSTPDQIIDLSRVDFDALRERFKQGHQRTQADILKGALSSRIAQMIRSNKTRLSYQERLQALINAYNEGSRNIESFFDDLVNLAQDLDEEDQRAIAEQLSEEELAVFDLLTRSGPDLSEKERGQVKQVARELLARLKTECLVLDWRKRQQARAAVRQSIETFLDQLPKKYGRRLYTRKCDEVYTHVYESYYGEGRSVYGVAA